MQPHNTFKGISCILLAVSIWAGWIVASRFAVKGSLTAYDVTAIRFAVAGMLMLPVVLKRGIRVGPWGLGSTLILAMLIGAPYTNIALLGMRFSPASHASIVINGTMLSVATLGGILLLKEKTTRGRVLGALCSVAGMIYMMVLRNHGTHAPQEWFGYGCFVISGAMWAGYVLLVRYWHIEAWHATSVVVVTSMILYLPLYLLFADSQIGLHNWQDVAFQVFYQGGLTGVVAFVAFNTGVHILGAARASLFIPLVPALATLIAIPVLHEIPSTPEWTAVAAVLFGVVLSSDVFLHAPKLVWWRK